MMSGGVDAMAVQNRAHLSRDLDERRRLLMHVLITEVEWQVVEAGGFIDV